MNSPNNLKILNYLSCLNSQELKDPPLVPSGPQAWGWINTGPTANESAQENIGKFLLLLVKSQWECCGGELGLEKVQ